MVVLGYGVKELRPFIFMIGEGELTSSNIYLGSLLKAAETHGNFTGRPVTCV